MKVVKFLTAIALTCALVACNRPAGELVGAAKATKFHEAPPLGMIFIKKGSFMMGANTQDAIFHEPDNTMMATVEAFWMDATEITNNEYHQFVNWVRDSIALTNLVNAGFTEFAIQPKNDDFDEENYRLDWRKKVPWNTQDEDMRDALAPMFFENGKLNTTRLYYHYSWMNYEDAVLQRNKFDVAMGKYPIGASVRVDTSWIDEFGQIQDSTLRRELRAPMDLLTEKIICVYPDTLVWMRDFQYSFNDPMMQKYFSHPGYYDYPVVGVTWEQAHAFCNWRTDYYLGNIKGADIQPYRLPTESEWEYAARGGRKLATYPWGSNYCRDKNGCFLANFKPYRGGYNDDTSTTTMKVGQFRPNDFGLFDMAGNVAEWTMSSYRSDANVSVHDLNPDFVYMARKDDPDILKRKVIRGGSWKDISYYLQNGVRTYEYQYESRPYIGFRCVRSYIGE